MRLLIYFIPIILFFPDIALSYPEFIGYKYSSCITCHYNGQGNGPINDYGRAVWASEIAGRMFSENKTAEELAESSGVLGKTQPWWWLRPGVKVRELFYYTNPGKSDSENRFVLMQAEANAAILFNKKQSLIFVGSFGYAPTPFRVKNSPGNQKTDEWISREHYLRWQAQKNLWLYAGMMDKVYGLRISNHTAYSRSRTGLAQNDQSHGFIAHYIQPTWEFSFNGFAGNLNQSGPSRQEGASFMFEYEFQPHSRIGTSALVSKNDFIEQKRFGVHSRTGFGDGVSLLSEVGIIDNKPTFGDPTLGYYVFAEAMQRLSRGYHLFVSGQGFKQDMSAEYADALKMSGGFLIFPMAKTEFRIEAENTKQLSNTKVQPDIWAILAQIHLSL